MKKILIIAIMSLILLITACNNNPIITKAKLTKKEYNILHIGNHNTFAYDFKMHNQYQNLHFIIDRYEFGQKVGSMSNIYSVSEKSDEGIIIAKVSDLNNGYHNWILAIGEDNDITSSEFTQYIEFEGVDSFSTVSSNNENLMIIEKRVVLGSICYTFDKEKSLMPPSDAFYEDINGNIQEIEDYDLVYVLKLVLY